MTNRQPQQQQQQQQHQQQQQQHQRQQQQQQQPRFDHSPFGGAEALFTDWIKWMNPDNADGENIFDTFIDKLGMNMNDVCEHIAKSNLSSFHPVDVFDNEDRIEVWIDVPGFDKDALEVRIKDKTLTVSGELRDHRPVRMYMKERPAPKFKRTLTLPAKVTAVGCASTLTNGVLQLSLRKAITEEGVQIPL